MQIRFALQQAAQELSASSDTARLDAELLLCKVLAKNRSYLFTWPEKELHSEQQIQLHNLVAQRLQGIPVAYLLGYREFWGMELEVSAATLIPRPDTELLVQLALDHLTSYTAPKILDLGTGTGAIALALAKERSDAQIMAVDKSAEALVVAERNQLKLGLSNVSLMRSDWFSALDKTTYFDLIVSNPPYIAASDPHLAQGDLRFEPLSALSSGRDGLRDITYLIQAAPKYLKDQGWLLLEHGYDQGLAVTQLLKNTGYTQVACYQDLSGNDRVSVGRSL
ncbi:peptide chain release factor N(5)-glutamine methyltransferase [uncultured Thiothrix sp.]|uniref:peptide chain release factor N(5)-glutamine methyltransferase n=1 Tax=uncultured Thiothrix sp. TaxID=223185 RepID=UPI00262A48AD|nr:peptide chain release factor N(5)-glutamine methyltransferase [uncultured Thiothrix sp.]